jgi:hypothetical protein
MFWTRLTISSLKIRFIHASEKHPIPTPKRGIPQKKYSPPGSRTVKFYIKGVNIEKADYYSPRI